jgi:hypothetical protein
MSVTHLRISILVVNILLAAGVPAFAVYNYWYGSSDGSDSRQEGKDRVTLVDPKTFRYSGGDAPAAVDSPGKISIVAMWVQPQPPAPPPPPPDPNKKVEEEKKSDGATSPESQNLEPGKLGEEGWKYVSYIRYSGGDPKKTFVVLQKGDPPGAPGVSALGSSKTGPRPRPSTNPAIRRNPATKAGKAVMQQASDRLAFGIWERRHTNEELGLDFILYSADEKQFIYLLPDNPKKYYALKYTTNSAYLDNPEDGIKPPPKPPEDPAAPEDDKKNKMIWRDSKDWQSSREKQFQDFLEGKITLTPATTSDGTGSSSTTPQPSNTTGTRTIAPSGAPRPTGAPTTPGAAGTPKPPTQEQMKDLRNTIDKIPKQDQQKILDALKGGSKGGTK